MIALGTPFAPGLVQKRIKVVVKFTFSHDRMYFQRIFINCPGRKFPVNSLKADSCRNRLGTDRLRELIYIENYIEYKEIYFRIIETKFYGYFT